VRRGSSFDKEAQVGENVGIARQTYEHWNNRDFDAFTDNLANGVIVMPGSGERLEGREGARQFAEMWANGFPDGRVQVDSVIDAGDQVVVEYTGRGTHTGTLVSPMGEIPATSRSVTLQLCDVWRFEGGIAKSLTTYFDSASLMTQLGVMPEAIGASA
jgi:steroid delta-isomerase-like uncharacterized protein